MSNAIWFLIIGAVSGWLAGLFVKGHGFGVWVDIIVGIVGAFIGGFLLSMLGIGTYGLIGELVASFVGAVILLWIMRMFSGNTAPNK